jgi:hypothetical protein
MRRVGESVQLLNGFGSSDGRNPFSPRILFAELDTLNKPVPVTRYGRNVVGPLPGLTERLSNVGHMSSERVVFDYRVGPYRVEYFPPLDNLASPRN